VKGGSDQVSYQVKALLSGLLSGLLRRTAPLLGGLTRVHAHAFRAADLRERLPASVVVQGRVAFGPSTAALKKPTMSSAEVTKVTRT
jgi:hypothetical protein